MSGRGRAARFENDVRFVQTHAPPQYSITGAYPGTRDMSQWAVSGSPASPVELNRRIAPQSHPSTAPDVRQAFARDGTRPSMETWADDTNSQNSLVDGTPW